MAPGRESRIDLGSLGSQPGADLTETMADADASGVTQARNRFKNKVLQQDQAAYSKTSKVISKKPESPWMSYNKLYSIQFGSSDYFQVAEEAVDKKDHNPGRSPVVIFKSFPHAGAKTRIHYMQQIDHKSFVSIRNSFSLDRECFVAFEFMPLSLSELAGHPLMNDLRLASILGPIVEGVMYLDRHSLEHAQLTCSNILVDTTGNVKIWAQEHLQAGPNRKKHVQDLRRITIQLLQGYIDEDDREDLEGTIQCPDGFNFVSAMQSASSVESLRKHPLLQLPWHSNRLTGMVSLVHIWADRGYRFCS